MASSTFINLRVNNAEQFKESITEPTPNNRIFLTYGRVTPWANESAPDASNTSVASAYEVWRNMIGGKRITGADVSHVIPRNNWRANSVFVAYDHLNTDLYNTANPFYVVTSDYGVYKCIANNSGANSTVEPSSISPNTVVITADGYIWKYMYTISDSELLRFTTSSYVPVKTLAADDGSDQWRVQTGAVDGAIHAIVMTNVGSDYTSTPNVAITGDGSSATATATRNAISNTVESISISDQGFDYTYATVTITGGGGVNAAARVVISPPGGHGSDPLYELGGRNVMVNPRLVNSESDVLPTTNDFRQIALIRDPYLKDSNTVASNTAFLQADTIVTTGSGDYDQDEIVYQGPSLASATFSATILSWNAVTGTATVINRNGESTSGSLIGSNTSVIRFITSVTEGLLEPYSGKLLYMDNIKPIIRAADQTEDFKIVVRF